MTRVELTVDDAARLQETMAQALRDRLVELELEGAVQIAGPALITHFGAEGWTPKSSGVLRRLVLCPTIWILAAQQYQRGLYDHGAEPGRYIGADLARLLTKKKGTNP